MGWLYGEQCHDNDPEGIGMLPESRRYDKGATALPYRANGHFTGRPEQWTDGSAIATDNVLNWTPSGWSQECASALGWWPDAMWWRAEDQVQDAFGQVVVSVPDHTGGGHDLVSGTGGEPSAINDDGDGFPAVGMLGLSIPFAHERLSFMAVTSPPALSYFTAYVVALQFVGNDHIVPGMAFKGHAGMVLLGTPQLGPTQWGVNQGTAGLLRPMPLLSGRHLWRIRADGETVRLAIDGCEAVKAGYSLRTPVSAFDIVYTGDLDPLPAPGGTDLGSSFVWYEIVYLPYPVDDTEDAAWVRFFGDKYKIQMEACDMLPIGAVVPYAGANTPAGYLECDGRSVAKSTYFLLYGAIADTWGAPPDSDHFILPDLRGRVPVGAGIGPGLTNVPLGQRDGQEGVALAVGQLPAHGHPLTDPGHDHAVFDPQHDHAAFLGDGFVCGFGGAGTEDDNAGARLGVSTATAPSATGVVVQANATGLTIGMTGSGDPVPTLPPRAAVRMLIFAGA